MNSNTPYASLDELDRDGALAEAVSRVGGHTRSSFLRRTAAFAGGGLVFAAAGPLSSAMAAGGVGKGDIDILNYALTLEYLESAFYNEAVSKGALSGETAIFAKTVAAHENAHVAALKKTLGSKAVKKPSFDFKGTTASQSLFQQTSKTLEDTGVEAYLGQAGNIKAKPVLAAAASILPVEARHAAWIANIIGKGSGSPSPAPDAFQPSATMASVLQTVQGTGFIAMAGSASAGDPMSGQPSMTG
jgi:rubrerythrin